LSIFFQIKNKKYSTLSFEFTGARLRRRFLQRMRAAGVVVLPSNEKTTTEPDDRAKKALAIMNGSDKNRLLVVKDDWFAGIITLKEMHIFLSIKIELRDYEKK
jgi:CBS domain-containing protein